MIFSLNFLTLKNLFFSQNFDYLTNQETKQEPVAGLDEGTKRKLQEMLKEPEIDAIILWINVICATSKLINSTTYKKNFFLTSRITSKIQLIMDSSAH